ncbi:Meiotically up-regulated gene protein [Smittium culicis]|uniref:Meiotically up-regulated gene protein n=1 Tax=Smittium culicis TaxID=133412 RepID=A0A1R1XVU9_9FUNG|nr:Meiotically up-regulated gene protein [Smittium culicis]
MASTIRKNIGKLGQWTGEKLGKEEKTELPELFKSLMAETEFKKTGTDVLYSALQLYILHLTKKKEATENSKNKIYLLENFGNSMIYLSESLPRDSLYGKVLRNMGNTELAINSSQCNFVSFVKEDFVTSLERQLDSFKEFSKLQKKFDSRRLDYDAKSNKLNRLKKESSVVEDECRTAQAKYEDSFDDVVSKMLAFQDSENESLQSLYKFYQAQLQFHRQATQSLEALEAIFSESLSSTRAPAIERYPNMKIKNQRNDDRGFHDFDSGYSTPRNNSIGNPNNSIPYSSSTQNFQNSYSSHEHNQFGNNTSTEGSYLKGTPSRRAPPPPPPKALRTPSKILRKALYDFVGVEPGELPLHVGDVVQVDNKIDDGWWSGTILSSSVDISVSRQGIFPVAYTQDYDEPVDTYIKSQNNSETSSNQHQSPNAIENTRKPSYASSGSLSRSATVSRLRSSPSNNVINDSGSYFQKNNSTTNNPSYDDSHSQSQNSYQKHQFNAGSSHQSNVDLQYFNNNTTASPKTLTRNATNPSLNSYNFLPSTRTISQNSQPPPIPATKSLSYRQPQSEDIGSFRTFHQTSNSNSNSNISKNFGNNNSPFVTNSINQPSNQQSFGPCSNCGCDDYEPNVFKKGSCNNCFHKH